MPRMETKIALFQSKEIRKALHENEWWFVIEDVVLALIESRDPKQYIQRMKQRDPELGQGWVQIVHTLPIPTTGGAQPMLCANTEGIFRLIQSIPSPKAEPFKRWLARVGYERMQEIENPELATKRTRALYKAKGYSDDWIEKRMRSIAVRDELTGEWKKRGVKEQRDYAILTAEISKAAFGLTPADYAKLKGLDRQNLRDHMTDLELIFSMLARPPRRKSPAPRTRRASPKTARPRAMAARSPAAHAATWRKKAGAKSSRGKIFSGSRSRRKRPRNFHLASGAGRRKSRRGVQPHAAGWAQAAGRRGPKSGTVLIRFVAKLSVEWRGLVRSSAFTRCRPPEGGTPNSFGNKPDKHGVEQPSRLSRSQGYRQTRRAVPPRRTGSLSHTLPRCARPREVANLAYFAAPLTPASRPRRDSAARSPCRCMRRVPRG